MARVGVPMPQMGESIAEGTVSVWLKNVGDRVERDEPIMEISTDKVDAEIPSPAAGVLAEIIVHAGETVEVGTTVAYVETDASSFLAGASAPDSVKEGSVVALLESGSLRQAGEPSRMDPPSNAERIHAGPQTAEDRLRTRSTPLVRRIAAEHGVELGSIAGTGRSGRVTKQDVLDFVRQRSRAAGSRKGNSANGAGGGVSWEEFYTHVEHPEVETRPGDRVRPLSRMTSLIADHMVLSRRTSAHVHSYFEVDYSHIDRIRARHRETWEAQGTKVTYTAFITKAVAQALREEPLINAAISGNNVIYRAEVNIGIAVALDWGLIVPVVKKADELSLVGAARTITDLAERARTKRLSPEEVQGGTFTITNPGVFGTVIGFPIISQPQVAILAVGAIEKRPVVISDEYGNDAIVARRRGFLALGYDHRLVNGADGDRFLARVKSILENYPDAV